MNKILTAATFTVLSLGLASLASAEGVKKSKSNVGNNRSAAEEPECGTAAAGDECAAEVVSPRDAASGLPTGKRQHKPLTITKEIDKSSPAATADADGDGAGDAAAVNHEVTSPRDAASGLATGRRQHTPVRVSTGDVDGDGMSGAAAQDHNSSRSNKSASASAPDGSGDGETDAQGMAINEKGMPGNYKAKAGKTGSAK
jgi:hypothetical protein